MSTPIVPHSLDDSLLLEAIARYKKAKACAKRIMRALARENIIRFRWQPTIRCLRTYTRWADKFYTCTECDESIMPGMDYFARVLVCGKRLWVERRHAGSCPDDPDKRVTEEETERERETMAA